MLGSRLGVSGSLRLIAAPAGAAALPSCSWTCAQHRRAIGGGSSGGGGWGGVSSGSSVGAGGAASLSGSSARRPPLMSAAAAATAASAGGGGDDKAAAAAAAATATPSTTTDIAVAFKSAEAQAAFGAAGFKLADSFAAEGFAVQQQAQDGGTSSGSTSSAFDAAAFFGHLRSRCMGHALLAARSVASTQEFMRAHSAVLPEGSVLVADRQTRGKGRGGNVWTSPDGCLMFTALRRLRVPGESAPFINYVVCLAVVQGVRDATAPLLRPPQPHSQEQPQQQQQQQQPQEQQQQQGVVAGSSGGLEVAIKWPNDIYFNGLKVGGALIHTTWSGDRFTVLTGVGLNVANSAPTTCLDDIVAARLQQQQQQAAGQQQQQQGQQQQGQQGQQPPPRVSREALLAAVLARLEAAFDAFEQRGFAPLEPLYLQSWLHSNQVVELAEDAATAGAAAAGAGLFAGGGAAAPRRVALTITGLSPHGFLLAVDALGQQYELTPDGNSLDMMQGLIKRKL